MADLATQQSPFQQNTVQQTDQMAGMSDVNTQLKGIITNLSNSNANITSLIAAIQAIFPHV